MLELIFLDYVMKLGSLFNACVFNNILLSRPTPNCQESYKYDWFARRLVIMKTCQEFSIYVKPVQEIYLKKKLLSFLVSHFYRSISRFFQFLVKQNENRTLTKG